MAARAILKTFIKFFEKILKIICKLISCLRFTYLLVSIVLDNTTNQNRVIEMTLAMNYGHEPCYKGEGTECSLL